MKAPLHRMTPDTNPTPKITATHMGDYYGNYVIRYVGTMDIREALKEATADDYYKWAKKYHPKHYFGTWFCLNQESFEGYGYHGPLKWDVWVVVKEDNPDWKPIPGTEYYQRVQPRDRNKKFLPIAVSEKDVEKWIQNSQFVLTD